MEKSDHKKKKKKKKKNSDRTSYVVWPITGPSN